jgi:hypothetical protein
MEASCANIPCQISYHVKNILIFNGQNFVKVRCLKLKNDL